MWPQDDVWAHYAPMFHLVDAYAIFAITWVGGAHTFMHTWDTRAALQQMAAKHVTATHVAGTAQMRLQRASSTAGFARATLAHSMSADGSHWSIARRI